MIYTSDVAGSYAAARRAIAPTPESDNGLAKTAGEAAEAFARQVQEVELTATGALRGEVETHHLVQSIVETQLAVDTVVAIRDKVVEAYQEILRMPV